jgi:predicted enzyme related to lactoylglutathione lyase
MAHSFVWVDIPVRDLDRSVRFYSGVLGAKVMKEQFGERAIGVFPHEGADVGGCLVVKEGEAPSAQGPMIYLNCSGRLDDAIRSVEANGGKVIQPKHAIGPHGFCAVVLDSEGNRVGLHSM